MNRLKLIVYLKFMNHSTDHTHIQSQRQFWEKIFTTLTIVYKKNSLFDVQVKILEVVDTGFRTPSLCWDFLFELLLRRWKPFSFIHILPLESFLDRVDLFFNDSQLLIQLVQLRNQLCIETGDERSCLCEVFGTFSTSLAFVGNSKISSHSGRQLWRLCLELPLGDGNYSMSSLES